MSVRWALVTSLKLIVGLPIFFAILALFLLNGITMLISPATWFRVPKHLPLPFVERWCRVEQMTSLFDLLAWPSPWVSFT